MKIISLYPYPRLALVLVGCGLLLLYFLTEIPLVVQASFFIVSILISGIPHGSLDHLVHHKNEELSGKRFSKILFLAFYHKFLFIYGLIWILSPEIAIITFIFLSAYHFGELDWIWLKTKENKLLKILSTIYGVALLSNMFLFHKTEMEPIIKSMNGYFTLEPSLLDILYESRVAFMSISMALVIFLIGIYIYQNKMSLKILAIALFQLAFLMIIITKLPILLGFGFYFSCWHSILTILSLKSYIWGKRSDWKSCIRNGLSNSIIALILVGLVIFVLEGFNELNSLISFMFIGIAVLTAPHMVVISTMFKHTKPQVNSLG